MNGRKLSRLESLTIVVSFTSEACVCALKAIRILSDVLVSCCACLNLSYLILYLIVYSFVQ